MDQLINQLSQITPVSLEAKAELVNLITKKTVAKNSYLLKAGQTCRNLYFLEKGLLRGVTNQNGKDITTWFACSHELVTSMDSFTAQEPSKESIEAIEDSQLYCLSYLDLQTLFNKFSEFNFIGRQLMEKNYIQLEQRTASLQFQTATDRYLNLINQSPQLLQQVPLGMIASYLGISQATLSRIRNKY